MLQEIPEHFDNFLYTPHNRYRLPALYNNKKFLLAPSVELLMGLPISANFTIGLVCQQTYINHLYISDEGSYLGNL